ncbi:ABC transporter permease subunit [Sansalvadorimonas verongulae]|uniref:ABC transporter permease subunit n=1 Tax=Sansalvadorimonas verongulae TaxID=2172824 RepID=UPI0012BCD224|nr:ABC transporter permease subunit [Sansalvadorimonas verongulae]MTI12875.1 ABC transporter permease subunit [Sansalvadorimonas verongulae]
MGAYFFKRFLLIIPTFFGVTLLIFSMTRVLPGGPVETMLMQAQMGGDAGGGFSTQNDSGQVLSPYQIEELKAFYGLDKPIMTAYVEWLNKIVRLDFGESNRYYQPVIDMITERLPISLTFGLVSLVLGYLISIPLGIVKALKHKTTIDFITSLAVYIGYVLPTMVVAIALLTIFAFKLNWFPLGGFYPNNYGELTGTWEQIKGIFPHVVLPLAAYTAGSFAYLTMLMKNNLMDNISADYVRTAVSKGLSFNRAVLRHAVRNSIIPIASQLGGLITVFFAGNFLVELIFNIDGIGLMSYNAIVERDYPVVMGQLAITVFLTLIGNILSDVIVAFVDPRVKFGN